MSLSKLAMASVLFRSRTLATSLLSSLTSPLPSSLPPPSPVPFPLPLHQYFQLLGQPSVRFYHDGRPRGPLWRGKKMIGKEALFVIQGLKRFKDNSEKLEKFVKTHVYRLLKLDMIAVLNELERQQEISLAIKIFREIQKQDWYKPDVYLNKDLIVTLARSRKMEEAMELWDNMRKENLFPDCQTYTEVIRGLLRYGSPSDAMNIYEDMKKCPEPPEELPFRVLLKGLLPHPSLRNRVKQDFEEIFPDRNIYDPPEEIFGLR